MDQYQFFTYPHIEASPDEWSVDSLVEAFAIINALPRWAQPSAIVLREETPNGVNMMRIAKRVGNGIWLMLEE